MIAGRSALLAQYAKSYEHASSTIVLQSYDRPAIESQHQLVPQWLLSALRRPQRIPNCWIEISGRQSTSRLLDRHIRYSALLSKD